MLDCCGHKRPLVLYSLLLLEETSLLLAAEEVGEHTKAVAVDAGTEHLLQRVDSR